MTQRDYVSILTVIIPLRETQRSGLSLLYMEAKGVEMHQH